MFGKGLLKVPEYLSCLSEKFLKINWDIEHSRVAMMVVIMKKENPEGRGGGMEMEASVEAVLPHSRFCCQTSTVLACILVWRQDSCMPCTGVRGVGEWLA